MKNKQGIITPLNQRLGICKQCGHKLSFLERHQKTAKSVVCKKCGAVIYDKNITY